MYLVTLFLEEFFLDILFYSFFSKILFLYQVS